MSKPTVTTMPLQDHAVWQRALRTRRPLGFELELTARCNLNCRHCYIRVPPRDETALKQEITAKEVREIGREAAAMGAIWCLVTGGEPLLREDFKEIYLALKELGLLITLFTNATLLNEEHATLFRDYPPRDIEISVYGTEATTYERVTRRRGSYAAFCRGLSLLDERGIPYRLKATIMRSNAHRFDAIEAFCRERTKDFFRFDPFLHLRYDGDASKNREILEERLSPEEIVELESRDPGRIRALKGQCQVPVPAAAKPVAENASAPLFLCKAGKRSFTVGHDARFRLCSALHHPSCVYDLRGGDLQESLSYAWEQFALSVFCIHSRRPSFLRSCAYCALQNLCMWCPALAHLETGELDGPVEEFCLTAQVRRRAFGGYGALSIG